MGHVLFGITLIHRGWRAFVVASVAVFGLLYGCRRPEPVDVMMAPAVCDSVPPRLAPGERVGGQLPSGISATADAGTVIGVVLQAQTERPLAGVTVSLRHIGSSLQSAPVARAISDGAGGFRLTPVRPGAYTLRMTTIGARARERPVTVRLGAIDTVRAEMVYMSCSGY